MIGKEILEHLAPRTSSDVVIFEMLTLVCPFLFYIKLINYYTLHLFIHFFQLVKIKIKCLLSKVVNSDIAQFFIILLLVFLFTLITSDSQPSANPCGECHLEPRARPSSVDASLRTSMRSTSPHSSWLHVEASTSLWEGGPR